MPAGVETALADQEPPRERIGGVRIPFIANRGQTNPAVAYYAPTFAGTVYVTRKGEIVYSLPASAKDAKRDVPAGAGWSLTETPVNGRTRIAAGERAAAQVSYFIGNDPGRWRSGIATYESVGLGEVWPGVFLSLQAHGDNVEKLFTVRPGAEPSRIRMRVAGAESLRVNGAGALVAATGLGEVTFTPPVAYQERDGVRRVVEVTYRAQGDEYGFSLGNYDPTLPVVVDPLLQATYLGGSGSDSGYAVAIHPTSGEVFVVGSAGSTNFPGTTGGAQPANGGFGDAFVARLNATLTTLTQATYLGGSGSDQALALAIHPTSGEVFVTGQTDGSFPGTTGGAQPALGGGVDVFVARLNATLTTLSQATYLGGSGVELGLALAIHPTSGEVFVAGVTDSPNFPGTPGGAQPALAGGGDGFVARLNAALTTLGQATYLGGSGGVGDDVRALAVHPTSGELFVVGTTFSTNFPGTAGGAQPASGGDFDAFAARLNAALTTLNQATYLGGIGFEIGYALAIHPTSGEAVVAGETGSLNFPGTAGGAQPAGGGASDVFLARLNATLTTLNQGTYLGGSGSDFGYALAIHPTSGEVFVGGLTLSTNFPGTAGGAQPVSGGGDEAYVARLNATLTTLNQATYVGGSGQDSAPGLAIHPTSGEVFVAGNTVSTNFPGTAGGAQPAFGGVRDAFVARLTADLAGIGQPTPTPTATPTVTPTGAPPTVTPTSPPGPGVPSNIPTLSPWMLGLLGAGLAAIGVLLMRRNA